MVFKPPTFHGDEPAIEPKGANSNASLEERVAAVLAVAGNIDASDIEVTVTREETIVLSGTVPTAAEREAVFATVANLPWIKRFDCRIRSKG
ncbi:BON domain-containing protein [Rhizobiaceae bacterium n13]|uniref:BON domain-containing protein n=1 Tax=Ferirhizobium litorale TaxID=2927786 RepID=A0AAE3QI03_9HYPH|nr:BON domain-containing protein [Fererhizobium litorale]MDI7862647.1 BON domain-containing protein [Fererhizobium litorale]MDI7923870.1 BON domain-containing protein [Fererhizobium litorale]